MYFSIHSSTSLHVFVRLFLRHSSSCSTHYMYFPLPSSLSFLCLLYTLHVLYFFVHSLTNTYNTHYVYFSIPSSTSVYISVIPLPAVHFTCTSQSTTPLSGLINPPCIHPLAVHITSFSRLLQYCTQPTSFMPCTRARTPYTVYII